MIAADAAAKPLSMKDLHPIVSAFDWLVANREALIIGTIVAAIIVAIMLALRLYGRKVVAEQGELVTWKAVVARVLAQTSILFMIVAALDTVTTYAEPPHRIGRLIDILFVIAFALQGAVWARELILGIISRRIAGEHGSGGLANALAIIRLLVSVTLFAIAIILILDNLGVNVTALVAGLGIGGIAIGLAAQGIFADLFAALAILFDKPFKKGDTIRYDQSTGTVERIGLKTTRLRSLTGEQLVMANTKLLEREIHNMAAARARRMTLYFAVAMTTPAEQLDRIPELAEEAVAARPGCKFARCAASGVGSGGIAFELVYDDKALDNNRTAQNRSAVLLGLLERLRGQKLELVRASEVAPPLAAF